MIGILQPGRVGDILQVLPIAKYFHDRGNHIVWPVELQYRSLFDYVPYVNPPNIGRRWPFIPRNYNIFRKHCLAYMDDMGIEEVIDLSIGYGTALDGWKEDGLPADQWRYREAGVPFEERFNLSIARRRYKEYELNKLLKLPKHYVLTHSRGVTVGKHNLGIPGAIEIVPVRGYTLFDWISVIEGCAHIHCVDSCIANMVNMLGLAKGRRTFHRCGADPISTATIDWGHDEPGEDISVLPGRESGYVLGTGITT
jgi:hypothetical protein